MTKKKLPAADEVVMARRKEGYGTVNTPHGEWREGAEIPMRFAEAVDREDCEAVGFEDVTTEDLNPELETAPIVESTAEEA